MNKFFPNFVILMALLVSGCSQFQRRAGHSGESTAMIESSPNEKENIPSPTALEISRSKRFLPGRLVIIQGPTSDSESLINVMAPRLKNYIYTVADSAGLPIEVKKYETVQYAPVLYKVDKLHVKGLKPGTTYKLTISDEYKASKTIVDQRTFKSLELQKQKLRFAAVSCMADDWRFQEVIDPMWERLRKQDLDLVILNGDVVYVDSFDFVERKSATEQDLWLRYIDSFRRIPFYHNEKLIPTLAAWDDHDFGTNDGDRDFRSKDTVKRVFNAFFSGPNLPGVFEKGPGGTYSVFTGFGQRLYLMDNRSFRQPNKEQQSQEPFGHWGQTQHQWLISSLTAHSIPSWIFNGNQLFNGKQLGFKEAFEANHPVHFQHFIKDLTRLKAPVVFASGDIHFTEVMKIPASRLGYETIEVTSSAMHSYSGEGWENPMRIPGAKTVEFNFVVVTSEAKNNSIKGQIRAVGLAPEDYFRLKFEVKK
jgi:phosphodiesterase/alkaline phosphatase D-like protein